MLRTTVREVLDELSIITMIIHTMNDDEDESYDDDYENDEKVLRTTVREALDELSKGNAVLVHCAQGKYVSSSSSLSSLSSSESASDIIVFITLAI